jgi:hypothetical protein
MRLEETPLLIEFHRLWVKFTRSQAVNKLYELLRRRYGDQ